ncbi:MAG TPA: hypothetical protein VGQ87_00115 [Patescibacteria group bacterium]|jgi:hypothetical protein|nr:hypothetical protein [Patescibacteria group bacterium]
MAQSKNNPVLIRNEQEENRQVKRDLAWVLTLNGIFFAILLVLFFVNRASGKVDQFFSKILKF